MKPFWSFALALLFLPAGAGGQEPPRPAPLTPEQKEQLKERDRFGKEADRLYQEGKLPEAVAAAEKVLAIERNVFGEAHEEVAGTLELLADLHDGLENVAAAQKARAAARKMLQGVLANKTKLLGEQHWQVTDARLELEYLERLVSRDRDERIRLRQAEELLHKAVSLHDQGKFAEALRLARQALDTREKLLGRQCRRYTASLSLLADQYEALADYSRAEPLRSQELEITKQLLGEKHPNYARCLHNLAEVYSQQGNFAKAEPLLRRALEINKEVLGEKHLGYAAGLNGLAMRYKERGDYARAEPLFRQSLEILKEVLGEKHPSYAIILNNLASNCEQRGDYTRAEPFYRQALEIKRQLVGEKHPDYALTLNNLAMLYKEQGDYARAESLYLQVLDIFRQALGENHPYFATGLLNLAELYRVQGDYARAEPLCRRALRITKQVLGEKHPLYVLSLNNLAVLHSQQHDFARAEALHRQVLAIRKQVLGEKHPLYAASLSNLGTVYYDQGDHARAEPLYRQALEIDRQVLGEKHPDHAHTLCNLAELYADKDDSAQAERLYHQALEIRKKVLGERHSDYADSLGHLAMLYRRQGDYARAEPLLRQAIAVFRNSGDDQPLSLTRLTAADFKPVPSCVLHLGYYSALLQDTLGPHPSWAQLRACDRAFALTADLLDRLREEGLTTVDSKARYGENFFEVFPRRLGLLRRLHALDGKAADLETAFTTAEQGTARAFLESVGKARAQTIGRVRPELQAEEQQLLRQIRQTDARIDKEDNQPLDKRNSDLVGKLLDERKQLEAQLQQLIARMEKESPQYAALKYPKPCTVGQARECLAANEVALLFVPGLKKSYVVLVEARPARDDKANGLAIFELPPAAELADLAAALTDRDCLNLPARVRCAGAEAYEALLSPLKDRIQGQDLLIVPSGPLCQLPFELLIEDGKFLIENHRIRYAASLTALYLGRQWDKARTQPKQPLWALGDPIYEAADVRLNKPVQVADAARFAQQNLWQSEGTRGGLFHRLVHSGREVEDIGRLLGVPAANLFSGEQASEANVKQASASGKLAEARYLHFATHGILGLDKGQQPALVLNLVGNDGQPDEHGGLNDGLLRLDEVTRLNLNADLVVLSACRTGQGRLYNGEGVRGLARAFLYAGSRGVVCSLWSVDDHETAALMVKMYSRLKEGDPAATALRDAKLAMIRAGKAPLYWAPFILIGE